MKPLTARDVAENPAVAARLINEQSKLIAQLQDCLADANKIIESLGVDLA